MSSKRYTDEFKIEAVKQVIDRNYKISDVANRLGVTTKSIHNWIAIYGNPSTQHQTIDAQQSELRKLKAELCSGLIELDTSIKDNTVNYWSPHESKESIQELSA